MSDKGFKVDGQKLGMALGALLFFGGAALIDSGSNVGLILIVALFFMWPFLKLFKTEEK